jgi:hypothetical protein
VKGGHLSKLCVSPFRKARAIYTLHFSVDEQGRKKRSY